MLSNPKPFKLSCYGIKTSKGADKVSFPMLNLIAISHKLAALTNFSFAASSISERAAALRLGLPMMNQRKV